MKKVSDTARKELKALTAKADTDIDFSDIPATAASDWIDAVRGKHYRPLKQQLTVRIDSDVLEWLKSEGKGYQSRLNDILRAAMVSRHRKNL
jgi:uncharacterized protein (DUF4415 family)